MARPSLFPRLCSLIRQLLLIFLFSSSFLITWLTCRKMNKKRKTRGVGSLTTLSPSSINVSSSCHGNNGVVSVVIALKNEARYIGKTIRNLESTTVDKTRVEIVLVDVGCKDNTFDVAKVSKGVIPIIEVKCSSSIGGSRGVALNSGAEMASGDILLFLRADSIVPPGYDETLRRQLIGTNTVLSAFKFDFDKSPAPLTRSMTVSLWLLSLYQNMMSSVCKLPRGSQALGVCRSTFRQNKYPNDILLLEDIAFVDRLRVHSASIGGEITILEQSVQSSSDDIVSIGALKSSVCSVMAFISWYHLGLSEAFVHKWFYVRLPRALSFYKL